jgi:hypothetical protein
MSRYEEVSYVMPWMFHGQTLKVSCTTLLVFSLVVGAYHLFSLVVVASAYFT